MQASIEPLKVQSLKAACINRLEGLILSGELRIGERLPSEREFAQRLEVSRPVLHEALVDLGTKGLVQIIPRRGVFVSDYRRSGSLALLSSLLAYHNGQLDPAFTQSLIDMRQIVETDAARLAGRKRTADHLVGFRTLLSEEARTPCGDPRALTSLDFSFHLQVAIASGNLVYPLLINSFQGVYTSLTGEFFRRYCGTAVVEAVHRFHQELVEALKAKEAENAARIMSAMLKHGERYLKGKQP
ncbi:MAG: FadR/GntR family transcriptional regulator [Anaerolineales bacterium]|jgi:DNA-binding FadR family transcriptional regulator